MTGNHMQLIGVNTFPKRGNLEFVNKEFSSINFDLII